MNCENAKNNLFLYLSGELPETEMSVFKEHLKTCSSCEDQLLEYQLFSKKYSTISKIKITEFEKEKIYQTVLRESKEREVSRYIKQVLAVAAILLISITIIFSMKYKDKNFDTLAIFEPTHMTSSKTTSPGLELELADFSLFEDISHKVDELNFTDLKVTFFFENNPRFAKIKQQIKTIKEDTFFRSES